MSETVKIVFQPPSAKQRGYLKQQRKNLVFQRELAKPNPEPETLDALVEYLAQYVIEPATREAAVDAIWEASQEQWFEMMAALRNLNQPAEASAQIPPA